MDLGLPSIRQAGYDSWIPLFHWSSHVASVGSSRLCLAVIPMSLRWTPACSAAGSGVWECRQSSAVISVSDSLSSRQLPCPGACRSPAGHLEQWGCKGPGLWDQHGERQLGGSTKLEFWWRWPRLCEHLDFSLGPLLLLPSIPQKLPPRTLPSKHSAYESPFPSLLLGEHR